MSVYIRNLYSPGFSYFRLSFYKTNLSISFSPWLREDKLGRSVYDKKSVVTTVSDENAATLHFLVKRIAEQELSTPVQFVIPCNNDTSLTFEFDGERARLTIEKKKEKVPFEFGVHRYKIKENGTVVEKVVQSGLLAFQKMLTAYLVAIAADRQHYGTIEELYPQQQSFASSW